MKIIEDLIGYIVFWILVLLFGGIIETIRSVITSAEYEYPGYLYNKYKVFRMKKQLGVLYKNEPFIWTDEQEDEQFRLAFEYAMTVH